MFSLNMKQIIDWKFLTPARGLDRIYKYLDIRIVRRLGNRCLASFLSERSHCKLWSSIHLVQNPLNRKGFFSAVTFDQGRLDISVASCISAKTIGKAWYNQIMNKTLNNPKDKLKNPFLFQGGKETKGYFEGWYFKQVNMSRGQTVSVIFGVSMNVEHAHSFVQLLLTDPLRTYYFEYPIDEFRIEPDAFQTGNNHFSKQGMQLDLHQDGFDCKGTLTFTQLTPLKTSFYMPSIMGPFAYIPGMECNHGVVSMRHQVDGTLELNDEIWTFSKDTGYIEKDWGRSFPKRYIWIQGNHFAESKANLMLSVADIPFLGLTFEGVIAQLDMPGQSIRIASYFGARKGKLMRTKDGFTLQLIQGRHRLNVVAKMDETGILKAPVHGSMHATIKEGLGGSVKVTFIQSGRIIWEGESEHCGIEIEGYGNQ